MKPHALPAASSSTPSGRDWTQHEGDALPYTDVLPDDWRPKVDQLVAEEVRDGSGGDDAMACVLTLPFFDCVDAEDEEEGEGLLG